MAICFPSRAPMQCGNCHSFSYSPATLRHCSSVFGVCNEIEMRHHISSHAMSKNAQLNSLLQVGYCIVVAALCNSIICKMLLNFNLFSTIVTIMS